MQPDEGLFTRQLPGDRFREQTDPVLQLENINVSFDGFRALTDLSLAIGVGELRCVIGPNGAGKTTLMDVITGKTRPQSGKALYDQSVDLTTLDPVAIARQGIGRKFQKPTVFEALTVAENLALAMKGDKSVWASLRARMSSEQDDRLNEVLRLLRLDGERYRQAGLLSHGQKQFLEIGMLLVQEPHLLLLDEPAAGMTDAETEYTAELFRTLAGQHSLMVVEHDMGFVETIADRVTVLHQGQVLAEGSLREVHQYYGGSHILRGVDFSARQGEVTCLLGRNGVGKTTLLKCLMGLIPARSGEVRWQDQNITHRKPHQRVQAGVAYVPQGREIFPRLTVEENLLMGLSRFPAREAQQVPEEIYQLFPVLRTMKQRPRSGRPSRTSSTVD